MRVTQIVSRIFRGEWLPFRRPATQSSLDAVLADARAALQAQRSEDRRFTRRTSLMNAQKEVLLIRDGLSQPNIEVETVLADISTELRQWTTAADLWSRVDRLSSQPEPAHIAKLAAALAQSGNFPQALKHAGRLGRGHTEHRRVRRRADLWAADYVIQTSHKLRDAGDYTQSDALLRAGLFLQERTLQDVELLRSAIEDVHRFRKGESAQEPRTAARDELISPPKAVPLSISGFLYSGSGAVVDLLRDSPAVSTNLTTQELGCFFGSYGPWKILKAGPTDLRRHAANFVSWSLLGVTPPFVTPPPAPKASLARLLKGSDNLAELVSIGLDFLRDVDNSERVGPHQVREALSRVFMRILGLDQDPKDFVLLNNSIRPYQFELLELLPDCRAIAVMRDPRDQFVSQQLESPDPIGIEQFIRQTRDRSEAFFAYLSTGKCKDRIIRIQFEDFVTQVSVRDQLLDDLGISAADFPRSRRFDDTSSQKNIGIHRARGQREDIRIIERELGDCIPSGL